MITVWGRATSSNVQIVMWALAEIGLECNRIDVGGSFGGTDTRDYLRMNPNKLVPTIQDGDLTLWESAAIVRYLGAKYANASFWPTDPVERARIDQWAEWSKTTFGPTLLTGIFLPLIVTREENRDAKALAAAVTRMQGLAKIIDARLAETAFLGGQHPAFGDCIFGTLLYRYFTLDFDRAETPHLRAYYDRLCARSAYARHAMVSYESMRAK
ncbi:glutathione S-transferase family protein [Mesorhizobium sp. YM1C-6-2]|uniref:glutathione S-transferase family protein n=1 Tax=Mesorhizobium sp. YM1C-6-2 TaxID=1827501 RepID=UPI000EF2803A|nr:glutathione S-transferase family protein [Mesorhizobium sp. YM1C-6-2]RLP25262.1 glutathione S-transferase family protein [Mesorhizobium sp. YM1C-6-2]